jgi:hypothetical protein
VTHLTSDLVDEVSGDLETGRTAEILLEDGRVVVARITQIQSGDIECPVDSCFRRFDSERGKKTHIGTFHPDYEGRLCECPTCGEEFAPTNGRSNQVYCCHECYLNDPSGTETLVCEQCGKTFDVKASHADERKHCSRACHAEAMRGSRSSNSREECECPVCEATFEVYPSVDQTYCSRDCASASHWEERSCPMCERLFEVRKTRDKSYCSQACYFESCREDRRPDGYYSLLEELVTEFDDVETALDRAEPHLAPEFDREHALLLAYLVDDDTQDYETAVTRAYVELDGGHSKSELRSRLFDVFASDPDYPDHVDVASLKSALAEDVLLEVTDELRVERALADEILDRFGVGDEFDRGSDLLDAVADAGEAS